MAHLGRKNPIKFAGKLAFLFMIYFPGVAFSQEDGGFDSQSVLQFTEKLINDHALIDDLKNELSSPESVLRDENVKIEFDRMIEISIGMRESMTILKNHMILIHRQLKENLENEIQTGGSETVQNIPGCGPVCRRIQLDIEIVSSQIDKIDNIYGEIIEYERTTASSREAAVVALESNRIDDVMLLLQNSVDGLSEVSGKMSSVRELNPDDRDPNMLDCPGPACPLSPSV